MTGRGKGAASQSERFGAPEGAPLAYPHALRLVRDAAARLAAETVPLAKAVGRVTARAVLSRDASPNADLAAMDGFAVRAADLHIAPAGGGCRMPVVGAVAAGDPRIEPQAPAAPGSAVRVATGALMPSGYDTVLPRETVAEAGDAITVGVPPATPVLTGANVRRAGEDHRPGDLVLAAGRRVEPAHVLLLANVGCAELTVTRRPRVAVLATGSEVVADLSASLRPGQVRNSNARYLVSALEATGCDVYAAGIVPDSPGTVRRELERVLGLTPPVDLILTIGGVSRGAADFVPAALASLGAGFVFQGVALRPGKPVLCTRMPGWPGLLFGLPGNPMAVLATFRTLVTPGVRALQGLPPEPCRDAVLGAAVRGRPPLTRLVLARGVPSGAGECVVPVGGQKASQVSALQSADRWLLIPPDREEMPAGAHVATLSL